MVQIVLEFEILQFHMKKKYKFDLYTNTRKCCLSLVMYRSVKIRVGIALKYKSNILIKKKKLAAIYL